MNDSWLTKLLRFVPNLDVYALETLGLMSSDSVSNEKKAEHLLSNHFTKRRTLYSTASPATLQKQAHDLHHIFPSVAYGQILHLLNAYQDLPNKEELVVRMILDRIEDRGGEEQQAGPLKRCSPMSADATSSIKVRRLADLMPHVVDHPQAELPPRSHNPPLTPFRMAEDRRPLPSSFAASCATVTSAQGAEPFGGPLAFGDDYRVPDVVDRGAVPVMNYAIPGPSQMATRSPGLFVGVENRVSSAYNRGYNVDPTEFQGSSHALTPPPTVINEEDYRPISFQGPSLTVAPPQTVTPPSTVIGENDYPPTGFQGRSQSASLFTDMSVLAASAPEAPLCLSVDNEGSSGSDTVETNENGDWIVANGGSPGADLPQFQAGGICVRHDMPPKLLPRTQNTEDFDLVTYIHQATKAPRLKITRTCRKYNLDRRVRPSPHVLTKLMDEMAIVIDDSDDENYAQASDMDNDFAIAEEIIAEDNNSTSVGDTVECEGAAALPVLNRAPQVEEATTRIDINLVNHLCAMFVDACPKYIRSLCRNKSMSDADLNDIITVILNNNGQYPKRPAKEPEPELPAENQLEILKDFLPDADPDYLRMIYDKCEGKADQLREFLAEATENRNYPTMKDYQRRQQLSAQQKQYTTDFTVENFIKVIPDPVAFFSDPTRKIKYNNNDSHYALIFLRNHFNRMPVRTIQCSFSGTQNDLARTIAHLEGLMRGGAFKMKTVRKTIPLPSNVENIPLLQELAYYAHKEEIHAYINEKKEKEKAEWEEAKNLGLLKTCTCCYDEEVLIRNIYRCERGCEFCKDCIVKGCEVRFGEGKLDFPCLGNCEGAFTLQTLQAVLSPKLFSKVAQKKALEEIKAAGIEELEMCPFCDFATIPAEGYTIFTCLNPECMKESCRKCKEPSHVPLRCDEIEMDEQVKARTLLENKMTEALLKKCYKCGVKFFKEEGCNKMTCSCGAQMCYVCGEPVLNYKHFNGNGGDRFDLCPLYSDTHVLNKENVLKGVKDAKAELGNVRLIYDPSADVDKHYEERRKMLPQDHLVRGQGPAQIPHHPFGPQMFELVNQQMNQLRGNFNF